ncbi:hypothetical protein BJ165DRAFT_1485036 [Panaeolus papilionaceus]|nr:hypothetical protein BJ165DRAFT_1485036 [Panaeolus papilionaceus]
MAWDTGDLGVDAWDARFKVRGRIPFRPCFSDSPYPFCSCYLVRFLFIRSESHHHRCCLPRVLVFSAYH